MSELVTDEMVHAAERALAWNECKDNLPNGKCECPSDAEIRRILLAAAPLIAGRALREAASEMDAEYEERTAKSGAYGQTKIRAALLMGAGMVRDRADRIEKGADHA